MINLLREKTQSTILSENIRKTCFKKKKKKEQNQKFINTNYRVDLSPSTRPRAFKPRCIVVTRGGKCPHLSFDSSWRLDRVTPSGFLFVKPVQFLATLWKKKMDRKELEVGSHSKPTPRKSTQHRKEVRDPHAHVKPVYIEYVIKLLINRATRVDTTEHWGSVEPYRKIQRRRFVTYRIFSTVNYSLRFASSRWKHLRDNFIDRWNGSEESY